MVKRCSQDFKDRAVGVLSDRLAADRSCSQWRAVNEIAPKLGTGNESLRRWYEQHLVNTGERQGLTREEHEEVKRLKRYVAQLRRANEILKTALVFSPSNSPIGPMAIANIDSHKDSFGVEPICRTLGASLEGGFITSRAYRLAKSRPASARSIRDRILARKLATIHAHNFGVYGIRKMWHAARRAGWDIGRDQVARLMKIAGIAGVRRGRTPITTRGSQVVDLRPDLVNRQFTASRPN